MSRDGFQELTTALEVPCKIDPADRLTVSHLDADGDARIEITCGDDLLLGGFVWLPRARLKELGEALIRLAEGA